MTATNATPTVANSINLTLNGGTYQIADATNSGTHLGNVVFNGGGTIKANGTISSFKNSNIILNGNVTVQGKQGSLAQISLPNAIGLVGAQTITVNAGLTLQVDTVINSTTVPVSTPPLLTVTGGGTLIANGEVGVGAATVNGGTLLLNGKNNLFFTTAGETANGTGTLGGSGAIGGTALIQSGGNLRPGDTATTASLSTGNVTFQSGSTCGVKINGTAAGQFDSLNVTGTVDLGNATLLLADSVAATGPITIITNDGTDAIAAPFVGIPLTGGIVVGTKASYAVSYKGGDGNDVTLTPILAGPYTVDNTGDADDGNYAVGQLTLGETINLANINPGADTITFKAGLGEVVLTSAVLAITDTSGTTTVTGPVAGTQVVTRSTAQVTPQFRIFNVASGVTANLSNLTITNGNSPTNGGGISNLGTLTVTNSTVAGNAAATSGGGIVNFGGSLTVTSSTVSGNTTATNGGAISSVNQGPLVVTNSTISGNSAAAVGGGINISSGTATLTNTTITNNHSDSDNTGGETGGGVYFNVLGSTLTNTLIAGNFRGTGTGADDASGAVVGTSANNLVGVDTNLTGINNGAQGNQIGTAAAPIDPLIAPLANNGGPTFTHALLLGSPLLGAGTKSGIANADQRGFLRPVDPTFNPEIGSYELQLVALAPATLPGGTVGTAYNQLLTASFPNQPAGTTYTFAAAGTLPAGLSLSPAGVIIGTPTTTGSSTFSVTATASTGDFLFPTNVTIAVTANTPPVAVADTANTANATAVSISVLGNDSDADNDALTVTSTTNPTNGNIVRNASQTISYTPNPTFAGNDTFTYTISDGKGGTSTANITVTVANAPPVANPDAATTKAVTAVTIAVLANDTDANGDLFFLAGSTKAANGSVTASGNSFVYTPNAGFVGTDTFTYTAGDGKGGTSNAATVTVTVTAVNPTKNPPTANPDSATAVTGIAKSINVLANDTDPNGDALSITGTTNPANGKVNVNANGSITYTPNDGFVGTDTFTYTISDGNGGTATAAVSVNVTAVASNLVNLVGFKQFAVGADAGSGAVTLFNTNGTPRFTITPFPGFTGGIRTAAADFNNDLIVGTGPGSATYVKIIDGATQKELFSVDPFEASFTGGVYVAAGDVNGDGIPDLAITPDEGGGPRVDVYSGAASFPKIIGFFGIDDLNFRGGARAAIADMTGDGVADLIVVAGFGGGPRVAGFDGRHSAKDFRRLLHLRTGVAQRHLCDRRRPQRRRQSRSHCRWWPGRWPACVGIRWCESGE